MSFQKKIEPLGAEGKEGSVTLQTFDKQSDPKQWRDKVSFWFLGFNNKMGNVVVITAAKDILLATLSEVKNVKKPRYCQILSTGVILLLATIPSFIMQYIQSKLSVYSRFYVTFSILLGFCGYLLLGIGSRPLLALIGVVLISLGFGIGDYELSKQSLLYNRKVAQSFRHGNRTAILWPAFYYAGFRFFGISMANVFLSLLSFPLLAILLFWLLLRHIKSSNISDSEDSEESMEVNKERSDFELFEDKCLYVIYLLKYMLPYGLVLFLQGFVNQGLYEFIYFRGNILDVDAQYRFYICIYNVGVFACLTTRTLLITNYVWICFILQLITTTVFVLDAIFFFTGFLWCIFLLIYIQGIITGVAITSTLIILEKEQSRKLDMGECVMKNLEYLMMILGGSLAVIIHFVLSNTQEPRRP